MKNISHGAGGVRRSTLYKGENMSQTPKKETSKQVFSPSDMERRWEKLKAAGKVPPLADVLKIVQKKP